MAYSRVNWINEQEGTTTPLNAENLNTMDEGISDIDERVTALEEGGGGDLDERVTALETDNTTNKSNISTNTSNISSLNGRVTTLEGESHVDDAYKTIKVGTTNIVASGEDTVTLKAGSNVTLSADATTKEVTISAPGGGGGSGGASSWSELSDKPFNSLDNDTVYSSNGVLKAKQSNDIVISHLLAGNNEITITCSLFTDDEALYTPLFEPTELDDDGKYKVLVCTHEIVDTTQGQITLTVAEAPTVNTRVAIEITKF